MRPQSRPLSRSRACRFRPRGVFGSAAAFESASAPVTAFLIAPIAEFLIILYLRSDAGRSGFGCLLGQGDARGIALVFLVAGIVMVVVAAGAFATRSCRVISAQYLESDEPQNGLGSSPVDIARA